MKKLMIILYLLFTSVICCDELQLNKNSLHNTLEKYKWKKRVFLLITKEEDTGLINEVDKFFINQKCKNDERNLELLKIRKGNNYHIKSKSYFKDKTGVWLIGYDGNIKVYSEDNTLLSNLHKLKDNMPIKKDEMKKF